MVASKVDFSSASISFKSWSSLMQIILHCPVDAQCLVVSTSFRSFRCQIKIIEIAVMTLAVSHITSTTGLIEQNHAQFKEGF